MRIRSNATFAYIYQMKPLILMGSARADGHTAGMVQLLRQALNCEAIDLADLQIGHYDYQHRNSGDDFLPLMRRIVSESDTLILATPVYWYAMSSLLKTFMDRITDCLKIEQETGRKLRGMTLAMLSCGSEEEETEGFEAPFQLSARYLGMHWAGHVHTWSDAGEISPQVRQRILDFADHLLRQP